MYRFERTGCLRRVQTAARARFRGRFLKTALRLEGLEDRVMLAGSPSIYVVNSTDGGNSGNGNTGTLPFVVGLANGDPNPAGSVIEFDPTVFDPHSLHKINLQATLDLTETAGPEVIDGPGASVATVNGGGNLQIFVVNSVTTARLSNLTIAHGAFDRGGGILNFGKLDVGGCTFESNAATSSGSGGAIFDGVGASLSVDHSTFKQNTAGQGGGIYVAGGVVTITNSLFQNNSALQSGGAIVNAGGTVDLTDSAFKTNAASGSGGAIANAAGMLDATNCTFSDNKVSSAGIEFSSIRGGAVAIADGSASLVGCQITKNMARYGGGIYVGSGSLTLSVSSVAGNFALSGGGLVNNGSLTVIQSEFADNTCQGIGGGIFNLKHMSVLDSTFTHNAAGSGAGLALNKTGASATIVGCTIAANSSGGQGGGIVLGGGQLTLINSTVANNSALSGGAIVTPGSFTAINDTIADNTAGRGVDVAGLLVDGGSTHLDNTIVAQNTVGSGPSATASDVVNSAGTMTGSYNLIGISHGGLKDGDNGNQVGVANAGLGSLADNGGPTETIALVAGSPAIDKGSDSISGVTVPTIDQRGALRGPAGLNAGSTVDVGAYEATSSYLVTTTADSFAVGTLRSAVGWANLSSNANPASISNPAPNTIVFDTSGVFSTPQTITLNQFLGTLEFSGTSVPVAVEGPVAAEVSVSGGGKVGVFQVDAGVTASLIDLTITDGSSGLGGGVANGGTVAIDDCVLSNNTANGGGALSNVGDLTLTDSTLIGNSTNLDFGGAVSNNGTMSVTDSTLADNLAVEGGGAIITNVSLTLTNVTITGNSAATIGGGIYETGGTLTCVNVTIAGNSAGQGGTGGGLEVDGGAAVIDNTIVALNVSGNGAHGNPSDIAVNSPGTLSGSYNLIGTGGSGGLADGVNGNQVGVANPGLGPLANNGGPTETMALLAGSPAIDKGKASISGVSVPTLDQRGAQRGPMAINAGPVPDVGAYEASSSYLVASTADSFDVGTLRAAVGWANVNSNANPDEQSHPAPNSVFFDGGGIFSTPQTITLVPALGTLDLTNTATAEEVFGTREDLLTISGGQRVEVFDVFAGVTATLANMTIAGGRAKALGSAGGIGPNIPSGGGGAVLNSGKLTIGVCILSDNSADQGGAVYNSSSATLSLIGSTVENNKARSGGGFYVAGGVVTLDGTLVEGNFAGLRGGGIANLGKLSLLQSQFDDNSASSSPGGAIANSGRLHAVDCTFSHNTASDGGALFNGSNATLSLINSSVVHNRGFSGGGLFVGGGMVTLLGSTFADNRATGGGGAVAIFGGTLALTNCTITGNDASEGGGVLVFESQGGNGDISDPPGVLTAVNVTIAYNNATDFGGGLVVGAGSQAVLENTIVAQNTAGSEGVTTPSDIVVEGNGTVNGTYNLIGTGGSGGLSGGNGTGNLVGVANPGLGMLADSGGPTETIALLAGSPAIDAGSNSISGVTVPTIDQRGALRGPVGLNAGPTTDIGAYEASSSYLVSTTTDSIDVGTLRAAVHWADVSTNANPANLLNPAPNTVVFDTNGVFNTPQTITLNPVLGTLELKGTSVPEVIDGPGAGTVSVSGGGNVEIFQVDMDVNASILGLTITDGASGLGGGVSNAGTLAISGCVISHNTAFGGGAINNESQLTLMNSTLVDNSAYSASGGAISNNGTMAVIDSTLRANSAFQGGGAIITFQPLTLTNVTLAGNSARQSGGAIELLLATASLTAVNVTIVDNSVRAAGTGGGLEVDGGTAALYNTIVAQNTQGTGTGAPASDITVKSPGALVGSYNLIGTGGSGGLVNGVNHNQVGVANPFLGTLASNGGPTQTIALLPGSPAIGAGSSTIPAVTVPNTDQRGVARPPNSIDVGAFQDQGFVLTLVPGGSPQTTGVNQPFPNPLAVIVTSPAGDPVAGGLVTFTAPTSGPSAVLTGSPAQIGSNGEALVTAVANGVVGSYVVSVIATGVATPAAFHLTNQAIVNVTRVTVKWGSAGSDALIVPGPAGGTLLPPGRTSDLPWLGISQLAITLSGSQTLTRNNVTVISAIGFNYGPITVAGSGANYTITLARPIRQADIVTFLISASGFTTFAGTLPVLPGDFNDNGKVDYPDETGVLYEILGVTKPTIFGDINGDGKVTIADYDYVVGAQGTKLPPAGGGMRGISVGRIAVVGRSSSGGAGLPGVVAAVVLPLSHLARFREGEPPGEPISQAARTEPRPPRITKAHLASGTSAPQPQKNPVVSLPASTTVAPRAEISLIARSRLRRGGGSSKRVLL